MLQKYDMRNKKLIICPFQYNLFEIFYKTYLSSINKKILLATNFKIDNFEIKNIQIFHKIF